MTCDHVRTVLATEPLEAWTAVEPHLGRCPECAELAAVLHERTRALEAELDAFAQAPSFEAAFAAASNPAPAPQSAQGARTMLDTTLHIGLIAAAASAALGLGFYASTPSGPAPAAPPIEATTTTTDCGDLTRLEPRAMTGSLEPEAVACLEARVEEDQELAPLRLLVVDAWSRKDLPLWEERAEHLATLTPEDPDLHYKLALHFSRQGVDGAEKTITHAEAAHENRTTWTGEMYVNRVNNLLKLRAVGAMTVWQAAPEDGEARQRTLGFAREWLEYTRAAGLDTETARKVCRAAGTEEDCAE